MLSGCALLGDAPDGQVSVAASLIFERKIMAPALYDVMALFPGIAISTLFVDRVTHLSDEGLDIAVRIAELPGYAPPMPVHVVHREEGMWRGACARL